MYMVHREDMMGALILIQESTEGVGEGSQMVVQKTQARWMDTKTRPIYMLSTRDTLQT